MHKTDQYIIKHNRRHEAKVNYIMQIGKVSVRKAIDRHIALLIAFLYNLVYVSDKTSML
jgi:hypothetical protein